ncbi:aldo/keto reductase [Lacticaseibacillus pabuli]|uniref:Aldo/keto reductase n=1 Tax=Lacticaseibacillus pabuli TaxID=3025672 RepID=A0ABY7WTQ6_9LACO|nr:aldo/keto reductase [Lacticaseibacillus sp. KACC 23028]WDF83141.1 aldo/keto reductase [Lacticaseibacillus sp. KACC 23028]
MFNAKVALGTWSWGHGKNGGDQVFGNHLTEDSLRPVVDAAMKSGLNLWDTAAVYGEGTSEELVGNLLKPYKREDYYLSTKFTPLFSDGSDDAMEKMLQGSLKRLHTDHIDLYWIHNSDDVEKWTPKLIPLVKSGVIKHVGVSNHNLAQVKRANEILAAGGVKLEAVQNHYSLLYPNSEEMGLLDYCKENGITFFPYMVLEQGALTGKYNQAHPFEGDSLRARTYNKVLPKLEALTDAMAEIGKKYDISTADVATAWAIAKGTQPIIGVTKPKYIPDTVKAINANLTPDEMQRLETLAAATHVDLTAGWEKNMEA